MDDARQSNDGMLDHSRLKLNLCRELMQGFGRPIDFLG